MTEKRVFVVDDDDAVRESLTLLLTLKGCVAEAFPSAAAFLAVATKEARGCVISDVRMPGMSGLELIEELRRRSIDLPVIIITGHGDVPMAVAALKAGAIDFIEKPYENSILIERARQAMAMNRPNEQHSDLSREVTARLAQLSPRERQVLDLVVEGLPNKLVAARMGISTRTVEIHRSHVMEKMQAQRLSDLVRMMTIREVVARQQAATLSGKPGD